MSYDYSGNDQKNIEEIQERVRMSQKQKEAEWEEINRKKKEGSGEEPFSQKPTLQEEGIMNKKDIEKKLKDFELILISMQKEVGSLGVVLSQHQQYFELLQKLSEQQKIEVVKN
tara:strand:+ start:49 stop:390 length:342 start_codon:yes stop_codon:yes gene_type:complete